MRIPSDTNSGSTKGRKSRHNTQKTFQVIKWIFILLTFALIGWSVKIVVLDKPVYESRAANPIFEVKEEQVIRGSILDTVGRVVAYSVFDSEDNSDLRKYPYGASLAHVVGYTGRGDSALEAELAFALLTPSSPGDQVAAWVTEERAEGNSVQITIDAELQQFIYELFGEYRGAVVITDPSTGAVKALVSAPSFDPEAIVDDWELIAEREDSPLFARATQGLYPPGSTFKIITSLTMYRSLPEFRSYTYSCNDYYSVDEQQIYCYGGGTHGDLDLANAFAESCNGYFASAGALMGMDAFQSSADLLHIGDDFGFILPQSTSSLGFDTYESDSMIAQSAIGQGKVLMTPFNLNMITCAIANGGVLYQPYLLDKVLTPSGKTVTETVPRLYASLMNEEEAAFLQELMEDVVTYGTASALYSDRYTVYGKTGTSQVEGQADNSWFTGFVKTVDKGELVITVLVENGGLEKRAVPIVAEILRYLYSPEY
ncbi:MAG: hypothetical protein HUJ69_05205 [Lachnospiraceae bacterium]|nr:hypothetical protein [Lachnospiraceae bacterium]